MSEERIKILSMLKEGKISVEEAERLLDAISKKVETIGEVNQGGEVPKKRFKYLRVIVDGGGSKKEKVNVKIPLNLIRAGVKMRSFIPHKTSDMLNLKFNEKGINFNLDDINPEKVDDFIDAFGEMLVDVEDGDDKVRVFCE
jgi:hypothetical protein